MFNEFTDDKFDVRIKWLTQKAKALFRVKDKSLTRPVKFVKVFAHMGKVILVKLF